MQGWKAGKLHCCGELDLLWQAHQGDVVQDVRDSVLSLFLEILNFLLVICFFKYLFYLMHNNIVFTNSKIHLFREVPLEIKVIKMTATVSLLVSLDLSIAGHLPLPQPDLGQLGSGALALRNSQL